LGAVDWQQIKFKNLLVYLFTSYKTTLYFFFNAAKEKDEAKKKANIKSQINLATTKIAYTQHQHVGNQT